MHDLRVFERENKEKFTGLVEQEFEKLGSIKVSFGLQVQFEIERNGELQEMKHYFKEDQPHVFNRNNKEMIKQILEEFMGRIKGEIESWSERGSGWGIDRIMTAYVNVARYQPLHGGTYLPLPAKLGNKKAIINVKNRDNECLKWALRSALFPALNGKNPNRPSSYPVNNGINYGGIDFPTPIKQIDKLEAQNGNLAINLFGWENNTVIVHRISRKEPNAPRINLMLIESGEIQHYCFVKRESALLFDKAINNKTFYCILCLTRFTRAHLLVDHKKYCNGVNGRPTKIDMPEEGKNILAFQNYHKQMKVPYMINADFEALVKKMHGCERDPDKKYKSYTEKTEMHEACGFAYIVVRSDGKVESAKNYRGHKAVEFFLKNIMQEEEKIREILAKPKTATVTQEDWDDFNHAENCYICEKNLVKESYWDSLPVYTKGLISKKEKYQGQYHKKCFFKEQKNQREALKEVGCVETEEGEFEIIMLKKPAEGDKCKAQAQTNCYFCERPLLQKNYRDVVKDHCHITGAYRRAAHNDCNLKMRIKPKTDQIPVVFHNLRGYDAHHLMQEMSNLHKEVKFLRQQHGEVHYLFSRRLAFHRQLELFARKLGLAGKSNAEGGIKNDIKSFKGQ